MGDCRIPYASATLARFQNPGDLVKPVELIAVGGGEALGLTERRIYNLLIKNAFGPDLGVPGKRFSIPTGALKQGIESNEQLAEALIKLMRTIVQVRMSDGSTERVQLLGWNSLTAGGRAYGVLRYSIPAELAGYLNNSTLFARLEVEVIRAFTSKYALSLYEQVSQWVNLKHTASKDFTIDQFRDALGVPEGKLLTFSSLNQIVVKPAVLELNALADFQVEVVPIKTGRKVSGLRVWWSFKDREGRTAALGELQQPRAGRLARLRGR